MGNELSIDLRLALKRLREDIREANKMIKEGLNKSLNLGGSQDKSSKEAGDSMDKLAVKTRRVNQALADQLNAWKKLQNFRKPVVSIYGQTAMPRQDYSQAGPTLNPTQGPMGPGGGLATGQPYLGGVPPMRIPPIIPKGGISVPPISTQDAATFWRRMITGSMSVMRGGAYGNVVGANQFMGAFGNTATGGRALGAMGLGGGAGGAAVATGGILVALLAVAAAVKALHIVIQQSIAASERAAQLYAKALGNGLGLNFTSQRSMLAGVLGVSEQDVYQFGAALAILNPRIAGAAKIAADSATTLAPLNYELKILKLDFEALFNTIAMDVAPTLSKIVNIFDSLVQVGEVYYQQQKKIAQFILDTLNSPVMRIAFANVPQGAMDSLRKLINSLGSGAIQQMPSPQSFMKQMPVSNFERMGLVASMGSSGLIDYSRRTAVATETIARHIVNGGGVPRTAFGLDPNVSNP